MHPDSTSLDQLHTEYLGMIKRARKKQTKGEREKRETKAKTNLYTGFMEYTHEVRPQVTRGAPITMYVL